MNLTTIVLVIVIVGLVVYLSSQYVSLPYNIPKSTTFGSPVPITMKMSSNYQDYIVDFNIVEVGEEAEIEVNIANTLPYKEGAPVQLTIHLPDDLELTGGQTEWQDTVYYGQAHQLKIKVKPLTKGLFVINATVKYTDFYLIEVSANEKYDIWVMTGKDGYRYFARTTEKSENPPEIILPFNNVFRLCSYIETRCDIPTLGLETKAIPA